MKKYGLFDILGPIMIGPSSSHTAGAVRLGQVARSLMDSNPVKVDFLLHGSFAKTYKGHGTDRALVAGLLGMEPSDDRLKVSLDIAKEKGIEVNFLQTDLGEVHPNTVKTVVTQDNGRTFDVTGSSIGGGSIKIININGDEIDFSGDYPTLLVKHTDVPGVVAKVSQELYKYNINIAFMRVFRSSKGKTATMLFEVDTPVSEEVVNHLQKIDGISSVRSLNLTVIQEVL